MAPLRTHNGFSLVELSIVLVILGLLTGGILAGQSLIRAAEIRTVTRDFQTYMAANFTFRDKYFAIAGDMANATQFWGASSLCSGASLDGVCNGNGDGNVVHSNFAANAPRESFQYWRQLAKAGLITGDYTGAWGSTGSTVPGVMVPKGALGNQSIYSINYAASSSFTGFYDLNYGNFIQFVGFGTSALTPQEAWNIDTKIDDGRPAYGKIIAIGSNDTCASARSGPPSAGTNLDADYRLSDAGKLCNLALRNL